MADRTDKMPKARTIPHRGGDKPPEDPQVGAALRSVYQKAVEEAVPDDLLALLSKLD